MIRPRSACLVWLVLLLAAPVGAQTVADFSADPTTVAQGQPVTFTNLTTSDGLFVLHDWSFGDGSSSAETNPVHAYEEPGSYTVTLTVNAIPLASDVETKVDYITVLPGVLDVDVVTSDVVGEVPLSVSFEAVDVGSALATAWSWDFGDGSSSDAAAPTHTYESVGSYDVSLIASVGGLSESITLPGLITVSPPDLQPSFEVSVSSGKVPLTVTFSDTSVGSTPDFWRWDFGDGIHTYEQNPTYTYKTQGDFTVTLTLIKDEYEAEHTVVDAVSATWPGLGAAFELFPTGGVAPLTVSVRDTSFAEVAVDAIFDPGDGSGVTWLQGPDHEHVYAYPGVYTPALTLQTNPWVPLLTKVAEASVKVVDPANLGFAHMPATPQVIEHPYRPLEGYVARLNDDPWPDYIIRSGSWCTLLNDGGTLTGKHTCGQESHSQKLAGVADMTGDGLDDLVWHGLYLRVDASDGQGDFEQVAPQEFVSFTDWGALLDADLDGDLDLALGNASEVELLINDAGSGVLLHEHQEVPSFAHGAAEVGTADVDGDGILDLVARDFWNGAYRMRWQRGDGVALEPGAQELYGDLPVSDWDVCDLDGDGASDLVLTTSGSGLVVAMGTGAGFGPFSSVSGPAPFSIHDVADMDADGDDDIIGDDGVYRLDGLSGVDHMVAFPYPYKGSSAVDLDLDGHVDLLRRAYNPPPEQPLQHETHVFYNRGTLGEWVDVGGALRGASGQAQLDGAGDLVGGQPLALGVADAFPSAPAFLVFGFSGLLEPFRDGVLVPSPDVVLALVTSATGTFELAATWPLGVPMGTTSWFQVWVAEPGGLSATNGLLGVAGG